MLNAIGRYDVLPEPRARDAFGVLYQGRDRATGHAVYLKALGAGSRQSSPIEAFEAYQTLLHETLIPPLERIESGDEDVVVSARPEGELLADCLPQLRQGGLTGRHRLLRILLDVARGVDFLHRSGLAHGHVSPAAVQTRCQAPFQTFLLCFGPAGPRPGHCYIPENPNLPYIAPEQLQGGGEQAADIYALGMLLYSAFAKAPSYAATSPYDVAEQIMWGDCAPFEPELEDIPAALRAAVLPDLQTVGAVASKALQRDPRTRYATAGELARILEDLSRRLSPIELGTQLYQSKKYDLAAPVLEEASKGPGALRAWVFLGKTYSEGLGDYEKGLLAFRRALKEDPGLVAAHEGLADHYARFGHYALAQREIDGLLRSAPDNILLIMRRGDLLGLSGDAEGALRTYERVRKLNPYHLAAYIRAIEIEFARDKIKEAEAVCAEALEIIQSVIRYGNLGASDIADIYLLRARIHRRNRLPDRAIAWSRKALEAAPGHTGSHALLAELYLESGDSEKAVEHFLAILRNAAGQKDVLEELARLMKRAKSGQA